MTSKFKRVLRNTGGVLLILFGAVMMPFPIVPGFVFVILGLGLIDLPIKSRAHVWLRQRWGWYRAIALRYQRAKQSLRNRSARRKAERRDRMIKAGRETPRIGGLDSMQVGGLEAPQDGALHIPQVGGLDLPEDRTTMPQPQLTPPQPRADTPHTRVDTPQPRADTPQSRANTAKPRGDTPRDRC